MRISTITESKQSLIEQRVRSHWALCESVTQDLTPEQRLVVENIVLASVPLHNIIPIMEKELTPQQIDQLFGNIEQSATDAGGNRTMIGKSKDVIDKAGQIIKSVGKKVQDTTPVKNFDAKYEQLKKQVVDKLGGEDSKIVTMTKQLGDYAKQNPGKTAVALGILTAIAGIASGPVGGAIAGQVLRQGMELVKGEKLSTAVGKGMKQAAVGAAIGAASDAFGGADATEYTIKSGDTLSQLAKDNNVSVKDIMDANPSIADPNQIAAGADITIPAPTGNPIYQDGIGAEPVNQAASASTDTGTDAAASAAPNSNKADFDSGTAAQDDPDFKGGTSAKDDPDFAPGQKPDDFDSMDPADKADALLDVPPGQWSADDYQLMKDQNMLTLQDTQTYYANNPGDIPAEARTSRVEMNKFLSAELGSEFDNANAMQRSKIAKYLMQRSKVADSVIPQGKTLSEGQIYLLFNRVTTVNEQWLAEGIVFESVFDAVRKQQLDEGPMDALKKAGAAVKGAAGSLASKGMQKLATAGKNLTTKVTADKLKSAWTKAGSPTDSNAVADILANAGVNAEVVNSVYKDMGIEAPTKLEPEQTQEPEAGAGGEQGAADDTTPTTPGQEEPQSDAGEETPADAAGTTDAGAEEPATGNDADAGAEQPQASAENPATGGSVDTTSAQPQAGTDATQQDPSAEEPAAETETVPAGTEVEFISKGGKATKAKVVGPSEDGDPNKVSISSGKQPYNISMDKLVDPKTKKPVAKTKVVNLAALAAQIKKQKPEVIDAIKGMLSGTEEPAVEPQAQETPAAAQPTKQLKPKIKPKVQQKTA
jgi:hypothetical protein